MGLERWLRTHRWLPDALLAVILAVILVPASLPLVFDSTSSASTKVVLAVAIVIVQLTVAFRRRYPSASYLVCAMAMAVVVSTPPLTGLEAAGFAEPLPAILLPTSGVFLVLLYSVAVEGVGRIPILALLVAGFGAVVTAARLLSATIISTIMPGGWPVPVIVVGALAAVVVAAWSLGRFVRVRKDYVVSLAERARQAEAERELRAVQAADRERARIAREMHDVVSHSLAVIVAQAEAGRMAAGKNAVLGVAVLPTIASTGRAAMADMRSLLGVLRDQPDDAAGDPGEMTRGSPAGSCGVATRVELPEIAVRQAEPLPGLIDIPALVDRVNATGVPVVLKAAGNPGELGPGAQLTAYRVVQEALTNVVKHARAVTRVVVQLVWNSESLQIRVLDDGGGQTGQIVGGNSSTGGQGLRGMRERVEAIGGTLQAGTRADRGFQIIADIPFDNGVSIEGVRRIT